MIKTIQLVVDDLAGRLRQDSEELKPVSGMFSRFDSLVSFIYKNYFVFSKLNTDDMEYHRLKNLCGFLYVGSKYKPNYKRPHHLFVGKIEFNTAADSLFRRR